MSFGTSILEGFREGFGRVLGGQNPRFSHFFRRFFESNFEARLGKAKNRFQRAMSVIDVPTTPRVEALGEG